MQVCEREGEAESSLLGMFLSTAENTEKSYYQSKWIIIGQPKLNRSLAMECVWRTVERLSQRDWMAWMKRPLAAELRCTALMKSCTGGSCDRLIKSLTWFTVSQVRCSESWRFWHWDTWQRGDKIQVRMYYRMCAFSSEKWSLINFRHMQCRVHLNWTGVCSLFMEVRKWLSHSAPDQK